MKYPKITFETKRYIKGKAILTRKNCCFIHLSSNTNALFWGSTLHNIVSFDHKTLKIVFIHVVQFFRYKDFIA